MAQSVLKRPMVQISKACVPYIILYIVSVLIITYVPALSTALPALLMGA